MKKLFTLCCALLLIASVNAQEFNIYFLKETQSGTADKELVVKGYLKNFTKQDVLYIWNMYPKGWEWNYKWDHYIVAGDTKYTKGMENGKFEVAAEDSILIEIHIEPNAKKGTGKLFFSLVGSDDPFSFVEDEVEVVILEGKKEKATEPKKEEE